MTNGILEIIARSAVIYLFVLLGLRVLGKRHIAQLTILDFVLILLISNVVQNAMVGNDSSLAGGIVAAAALLALNYVLTFLLQRFGKVEKLFEGTPTLLVHNGRSIREHLAQEKITEEELERVIREHGIQSISEVKNVVMELDGTISVIGMDRTEKHIETFKHRRTKYQQDKPL